jgi:hypothetical protein
MFENKIHTPHPRYLSNFVEPTIQVQHDHQINGLEHLLLVVGKVGVCHRENVLRPNFEDFIGLLVDCHCCGFVKPNIQFSSHMIDTRFNMRALKGFVDTSR